MALRPTSLPGLLLALLCAAAGFRVPIFAGSTNLASWRFSNGVIQGDQGQQPIIQQNVSLVTGFEGQGVQFPASGVAKLQFKGIETSGQMNVALDRGTIHFRVKPNWFSNDPAFDFYFNGVLLSTLGGVGPGAWITLVQTTNLAVRIDPNGTNLVLVSQDLSGNTVTNVQVPIHVRSRSTRSSKSLPGSAYWYDCVVSYSPDRTELYWRLPEIAQLVQGSFASGSGIATLPNLSDRNTFISFGSAVDGSGAINGILDEIFTFSAAGTPLPAPWTISARDSINPPGIDLVWSSPPTNLLIEIKRRLAGTTNWGPAIPVIGTNYLDTTIVPGERYEYNLNTHLQASPGFSDPRVGFDDPFGQYVTATSAGKPVENRGKIILLVDKTLTNAIASDLSAFMTNLVGDGWEIIRGDMPRHIDDPGISFLTNYFSITNTIAPFVRTNYALFSTNIKYILILGHVTIPYSGTLADDGHYSSDIHGTDFGAWPTDLYYGDIDGIWHDSLSVLGETYPASINAPGDGKFDEDYLPANALGVARLEIPCARIDFAMLPDFADSEAALLSKYLRKDIEYRNGLRPFAAEAAAIDYLANPPLIPEETATELISRSAFLKQPQAADPFAGSSSFLFGVEGGPGAFDRINDARTYQHATGDIAAGTTSTNCAFYYLRGSYFPDWNFPNDFLRSILGTTNGGLGAVSIFRTKAWRANGLGVGYTIANELKDVINDQVSGGWGSSVRTMEFMGDCTLRYPILAPPASPQIARTNGSIVLSWSPPAGGSPLYHVYRSTGGILGQFQRLTTTPLSKTNYTDSAPVTGTNLYMIRALSPVTTGEGSFTNLSQGVFIQASYDAAACCIPDQTTDEDVALGPVPFSIGSAASESGVTVSATSSNTALIPDENILLDGTDADRTVTVTPEPEQFGTTQISILVHSDLSSFVLTFQVTVNSVNDRPSFLRGSDQQVPETNVTAQALAPGWASAMSAGPLNESTQQLSFLVTYDNPQLFSIPPAISAITGDLTYTPAPNQRGTSQLSVTLRDDGGTENTGLDSSYPQPFSITIGLTADSDGDGLPDDFEIAHGLNPHSDPGDDSEASADADGDGFSNLDEFRAGTDPLNSRSALRFTDALSDPSGMKLQFDLVPGKSYAVEINDTFPSEDWSPSPILTELSDDGHSIVEVDGEQSIRTNRFYRLTASDLNGNLYSELAGFYKISLLSNSDTLVSIPFFRPPAEFGAVASVAGNAVQLRGAPPWDAGQWTYASGARTNTYFLLIRSGMQEGAFHTITNNTTDTLSLDLEGGSLSGVLPGDRAAIVPYWTLGTIFPGGEGVHASPAPGNRLMEVLLPDIGGAGANLATARTYYFWNGAWRQVGQNSAIPNDDVILPDMYFWVRNNTSVKAELVASGSVLSSKLQSLVKRNGASRQDNLLALPRPVAATLDESGLFESGVVRDSSSGANRLDELFAFNNSTQARNKSASDTYYHAGGVWRKVGATTNSGTEPVFQPGTGIILRAGTNLSSIVWTNSPNY